MRHDLVRASARGATNVTFQDYYLKSIMIDLCTLRNSTTRVVAEIKTMMIVVPIHGLVGSQNHNNASLGAL